MFIPIWGIDPIWLIFFQGVEPATNWMTFYMFVQQRQMKVREKKRPARHTQYLQGCVLCCGPIISDLLQCLSFLTIFADIKASDFTDI